MTRARNAATHRVVETSWNGDTRIVASCGNADVAEITAKALAVAYCSLEPRPTFNDGGAKKYHVEFARGLRSGEITGFADARLSWMIGP